MLSNRMSWAMGALAVVAMVVAVGVAFNGYRNQPPPSGPRPANPLAGRVEPGDVDPNAPRLFDQTGPIRVHVAGAVRKPGVYSMPSWSRVIDALKKAGGASSNADLDAINLADRLKDGEQLRIPHKGHVAPATLHPPTPEPPPVPRAAGGSRPGRYPFATGDALDEGMMGAVAGSRQSTGARAGHVDLNTATADQLEALPGIGPKTAESILTFRRENGPFLRPDDIMNVKGIGPAKFEKLRPYIAAP